MTRRHTSSEWGFHQGDAEGPAAVNADLAPALRELGTDAADPGYAQMIREELVEGIRHEAMLRRIRDRLGSQGDATHLRYTRRAWLELQGRRHCTRATAQTS